MDQRPERRQLSFRKRLQQSHSLILTLSIIALGPPAALLSAQAPHGSLNNQQFLQRGTDAKTRSAEDKARETVSITDYAGGVADGVSDNTAAMNAAIAALIPFGGGVLHLPKNANCYVFDTITYPAWPSTYLTEGDGPWATCLTPKFANKSIFGPHVTDVNAPSLGNIWRGFRIVPHKDGSDATHPLIDVRGWFSPQYDEIQYVTNPAGTVYTGTASTSVSGSTYEVTLLSGATFANAPPNSAIRIAAIGAAAFTGSGLNDATRCGTFSASTTDLFVATISATGTPDHFTWTKNGGAASSPVAITSSCQVMADGVGIQFAATTGHTLAANWTIKATYNWYQIASVIDATHAYLTASAGVNTSQAFTWQTGDAALWFLCDDQLPGSSGCYEPIFRRISDTVQSGPATILRITGTVNDVNAENWDVRENNTGLTSGISIANGVGLVKVKNMSCQGNLVLYGGCVAGGSRTEITGGYFEHNFRDFDLDIGGLGAAFPYIHGNKIDDNSIDFANSVGASLEDNLASLSHYYDGVTPPIGSELKYGNVHYNVALASLAGGISVGGISAPGFAAPTVLPNQIVGLAAGTYAYFISAVDGSGETKADDAVSVTVTGGQAPAQIGISWVPSNGARKYDIYGRNPDAGTVSTVGTAVTWVSGTTFVSQMIGRPINIHGVPYTVATVPTSTSLTLTASAGVQTAVADFWQLGQLMVSVSQESMSGAGSGAFYFIDDGTVTPAGAYNPTSDTTGRIVANAEIRGFANEHITGPVLHEADDQTLQTLSVGPIADAEFPDNSVRVNGDSSADMATTAWGAAQPGSFLARFGRGTSASHADVQSGDSVGIFHTLGWLNGAFRSAAAIVGSMNNVVPGASFAYDGIGSMRVRAAQAGVVYDWEVIRATQLQGVHGTGTVDIKGTVSVDTLASAGTECVQASSAGVLSVAPCAPGGFTGTKTRTICTVPATPSGCTNVTETYANGSLQ